VREGSPAAAATPQVQYVMPMLLAIEASRLHDRGLENRADY